MGSQGLNDMSFTDKAKKIRDTKTPEELTNMYDEWARNSGYEKVRGVNESDIWR